MRSVTVNGASSTHGADMSCRYLTCRSVPSVIHMSALKPSSAYVTSVTLAHMEEGVVSVDRQVCFSIVYSYNMELNWLL